MCPTLNTFQHIHADEELQYLSRRIEDLGVVRSAYATPWLVVRLHQAAPFEQDNTDKAYEGGGGVSSSAAARARYKGRLQ